MNDFIVKYKYSSILLIFLMVIILAIFLYLSFFYFKVDIKGLSEDIEVKSTATDRLALEQIRANTVDNVLYKQLVPFDLSEIEAVSSNVSANPFKVEDQKE